MPTRSGRGLLKDVTPSATPASVPPAEPVIDDNVEAGLSAYELQRLANIRANEEVLKQLNLLPLSSQGLGVRSARAAPSQRGIGATKKRAASPAVATRESNRTRGKAAEYTGIRVEHSDGRVELSSGELVMPKTGKIMQAEAEVDPSQPLAFRHLNKTDEEEELEDDESGGGAAVTESREPFERDVALLQLITDGCHTSGGKASSVRGGVKAKSTIKCAALAAPAEAAEAATSLATCNLDDQMVVKACRSAVVHLHFQPRDDTLLLAAADKEGHVSFWHASRALDDPSDGVYLFKPHQQYVSGLAWAPGGMEAVLSASYDGTIKCLDLERREFRCLYHEAEHEISAFALGVGALWLATNEGELGAVDPRTGAQADVKVSARHKKKINTLSFDAASGREWLLASAGSDKCVKVWDVRKMKKEAMETFELPNASQAAEFAPDGSSRLAVTCFDDHLRVYSLGEGRAAGGDGGSAPCLKIRHCTQTGRWVVPFRAIWTAAGDGVLVGGMKRTAEVYDPVRGKRIASLSSEHMTAIPSRNAAHRGGKAVAAATNSGRIHLYQAD